MSDRSLPCLYRLSFCADCKHRRVVGRRPFCMDASLVARRQLLLRVSTITLNKYLHAIRHVPAHNVSRVCPSNMYNPPRTFDGNLHEKPVFPFYSDTFHLMLGGYQFDHEYNTSEYLPCHPSVTEILARISLYGEVYYALWLPGLNIRYPVYPVSFL